jgi:uncharacterized membrane protein YphA (DoxX/SURF4 family)
MFINSSYHRRYLIGHFLLRAGVSFSFLYPPIGILSDPSGWVQYFPVFLQNLPIGLTALMYTYAGLELVLSLWIMSGRYPRSSGTIAAILLLLIVFVNLDDFNVVFRNVSLAFTALALSLLPRPRVSVPAAT